jgi:plastocyanin
MRIACWVEWQGLFDGHLVCRFWGWWCRTLAKEATRNNKRLIIPAKVRRIEYMWICNKKCLGMARCETLSPCSITLAAEATDAGRISAPNGEEIIMVSLRFLSLLVLALAICFPAGRVGAQSSNESYRATVDSDGVQHVNILAGDYFFRPSHIIVKVNTPVMLVVRVEQGVIPHGLMLKAPKANILIDEDLNQQSQTFTFTATAPGKYAFYCPKKLLFFKSHREHGMEGVLEVVE